MTKHQRAWKVYLGVFVVVLILVGMVASGVSRLFASPEDVTYGVTFSHLYAEYLNGEWEETYGAILTDLDVDHLRIPVQWSEVEREQGELDFSVFDQMMDTAAKNDVEVTLVIGYKVPRWPECFIPDWAEYLPSEERRVASLAFFSQVVERYEEHEALARWQVENEPFFFFGECPTPDPARVEETIALVRELDPTHPIQQTTSGEQSLWAFAATRADIVG